MLRSYYCIQYTCCFWLSNNCDGLIKCAYINDFNSGNNYVGEDNFLFTIFEKRYFSYLLLTRVYLLRFRRVLRRLQLDLSINVIRAVADCTPWAIETVLGVLRHKINLRLSRSHGDWGSGDMGWLQEETGSRNNDDRQRNTSMEYYIDYAEPSAAQHKYRRIGDEVLHCL